MEVPFLERGMLLFSLPVARWRAIWLVLLERRGTILRRWISVHADSNCKVQVNQEENNIRADCWIIDESEVKRQ